MAHAARTPCGRDGPPEPRRQPAAVAEATVCVPCRCHTQLHEWHAAAWCDRGRGRGRAGKAPGPLDEMADRLRTADAYVACTSEYNHAPSPALLNTLNHFGSSLFSFKPSCIVSYSAGQWGGTRAAHALRYPSVGSRGDDLII